jgi:signal transduction histidine kinase
MKLGPGIPDDASGNALDDAELLLFPGLAPEQPQHLDRGYTTAQFPSVDVFQQLINGLPEQIALTDEHWNILAVNHAWTKTAAQYDYFDLLPGTNYLKFCQAKAEEGHTAAGIVARGIAEIDAGTRESYRFVYHGSDRWEGHAFQLCINRLEISGQTFATVTRYDVTEVVQLRRLREGFSHSLIEGQAEERRRIAGEVHDSTMQLLAGLGLALGQLKRTRKSNTTVEIIADMEQLLGEAHREIRSISYLAHPPLLKELGLASALRQLVDGFSRRTGLSVSLQIDEKPEYCWRNAEVCLYRVIQEALSNIHRHAHATGAAVVLTIRRQMIHVVVADNGIGMPDEIRQGVGLSSMKQRILEFGGRLTLRSASPGTILIASVPWQSQIRSVGDLAMPA